MKSTFLTAAFASLMLTSAQSADDSDRIKLADELLTTMRVESTFRSGWTSYPPAADGADHPDSAEVSRALWLKLKPKYVKAYAEVYSADELRALITFFKSPAGQTYLEKTPELNRRLMAAHGLIEPEPPKSK